jgi:ElaB/YqjD/DUF883 family membrane-anchored ribosome-binding protein
MTARNQDRPLSTRLGELEHAFVVAGHRIRDAELAHRRAEADVARLRDVVIDALADNDEPAAAKASKVRDKADMALRDTAERLEGARRGAAKAETARGMFAREHADGLIAERRPDAIAAAQAVEDAIDALARSQAVWNGVAAEVAAMLRAAGRGSGAVPNFPDALGRLVKDARRADGVPVPVPLPGDHAHVRVAPYDDPDEEVREQARATMTGSPPA